MADDAILRIGVETKEAVQGIERFQKQATASLTGIQGAFSSLKTVAVAAIAALGAREVYRFFKDGVEAAQQQQDAINDLNTSLQLTGIYSTETSRAMQSLASSIQETSTFGDEAVLSSAALLQNIARLDEEGLKQATVGATNLAAALNLDLNTAFSLVGKAMSGNVGALSRYGVQIKKGTNEIETHANVLRALGDFQGAAESKTNTFSGALAQMNNLWGDLKESIGGIITQNPVLIGVIKKMSEGFARIITLIDSNRDKVIGLFNKVILGAVKMIPSIVKGFGVFVTFVSEGAAQVLNLYSYWLKFVEVVTRYNPFITAADTLQRTLTGLLAGFTKTIELFLGILAKIPGDFGDFAEESRENLQGISEYLVEFAGRNKTLNDSIGDGFALASEWADKASKSIGAVGPKIGKGIEELGGALSGLEEDIAGVSLEQKKLAKTAGSAAEEEEKLAESAAQMLYPLADLLKAEQDIRAELEKRGKSASDLIDIELNAARERAALTDFELASQGKLTEQAQAVIEAYTAAAEAKAALAKQDASVNGRIRAAIDNITVMDIGMALKDAISGALDFGAYLFDGIINGKFIDAIESFMNEFPALLARTLERTPVILEQFIKAVPKITQAIVDALPRLGQTIGKALPGLVKSLSAALPKLLKSLPDLFVPLIRALPAAFQSILSKLPEAIRSAFESFGFIAAEIIKVIPELIVALLDNMDEIALAFSEGVANASSQIITALIDTFLIEGGLERVVKAFILAQPRIAIALLQGIARGIDAIGVALGDGASRAFKTAVGNTNWFKWPPIVEPNWISKLQIKTPGWVQTFSDAVNRLTNWKPAQVGGSGGGGGVIQETLERWGAARGMTVPPGFPNDSFPANLTSGEMVIPRNDVDRLSAFLDSQDRAVGTRDQAGGIRNQSPVNVILKVGERELAKVLLDLNRMGYRTA
jgi:hypothetical protein